MLFQTRYALVLLASFALCGCQAISKLDTLNFEAGTHDAGSRDDAVSDTDAAPRAAVGRAKNTAKCLVEEGSSCDPVAQCPACDEGKSCLVSGKEERASCMNAGRQDPWSACGASSECPAGQTCDRGSCRPYCASDADCGEDACLPARGPDGQASKKISVCWKRCDKVGKEDECASATKCRAVPTPFGETGRFCVAPLDPCPWVEDGTCNEPDKGDGACAAGSDAHDCNCPPLFKDGSCNPVEQCGCKKGNTCAAFVVDPERPGHWTAECFMAGTVQLYGECNGANDCAPGLFCPVGAGVCNRYCKNDDDCEGGACNHATVDENIEFGFCARACQRDNKRGCSGTDVCAEIDADRYIFSSLGTFKKSGDFCVTAISPKYCPQDGICDDPSGTGLCAAGSDQADCCKPPGDGPCDPYKQCGCPDGTQCQIVDNFNATACLPAGGLPEGSICTAQSDQCAPGLQCFFNTCRRYCSDFHDCGGIKSLCLKFPEKSIPDKAAKYGACAYDCDPGNPECPGEMQCIAVGLGTSQCSIPERSCDTNNGVCDDTRPGGLHHCELGGDPECCEIAEGSACNADAHCGCERQPGTECRMQAGSTKATCQPIHTEPLSEACKDASDPACCNPRFAGSECDPVAQCGCENKPGT